MLDVNSNSLSLLNEEGCVRDDLNLPPGDLSHTIKQRFRDGQDLVVVVLKAIDKEAVISVKNTQK